MEKPLVSCIMPTYNRREFVPHAIHYFLRQDYPNKELIIIDDGTDIIEDLVPNDERILYFRLKQKITLGAKLNLACEHAQGTIIAHWDDDDWYAPRRLTCQTETLLNEGTDVCGINNLLYFDMHRNRAFQYIYPPNQRKWLLGSTLCYQKNIWTNIRFADIDVGMDGLFVWAIPPHRVTVLQDSTFSVFMIHKHNVSPKITSGAWWHPYPVEKIQHLLDSDWAFYKTDHTADTYSPRPRNARSEHHVKKSVKPIRNIFACLVHESQECIVDLVRNLRYHDSSSVILLYDGGKDNGLLHDHFPLEQYGVVLHPSPRPMEWGCLHNFALECMKFALDNFSFDTLTIVDSDQLGIRSGYSGYLGKFTSGQTGIGMLGNSPGPLPSTTNIAPAVQAFKEVNLWKRFLKRFPKGEEKFVHWTFWPSTVFLFDAVRDLTKLFVTDANLQNIMRRSKIWATEEVILPTLVALLGYKIVRNPCSYDYVKYKAKFTIRDVDMAFNRKDVFWSHPVSRSYGDHIRKHIRSKFNHYEHFSEERSAMIASEVDSKLDLPLTIPILKVMNKVKGWLQEEEADLLIAATRKTLACLQKPHSIVEVGSYLGRSTVVLGSVMRAACTDGKVYAIDPHEGKLGAIDEGLQLVPPTLEEFKRNIESAGLASIVEIIRSHSTDVIWDKPISLLFIDGLHDYPSVARDFWHFVKWIRPGGLIAFHDYADYYPGVKAFVNELLNNDGYKLLNRAKSLVVLEKKEYVS